MRFTHYLNISSPYFSISSFRLRLKCLEVLVVIGVADGVPSDDSDPSEDELGVMESLSDNLFDKFKEIFGEDVVEEDSSFLNKW